MLKKIAGALSAIALSAGSAVAAPGYYVNVENNAGWTGSDSVGNATDFHIGADGMLGESFAWYGQLGPQLQVPNGGDTDVVLSGKIGGSLPITDSPLHMWKRPSSLMTMQTLTEPSSVSPPASTDN